MFPNTIVTVAGFRYSRDIKYTILQIVKYNMFKTGNGISIDNTFEDFNNVMEPITIIIKAEK